jgi:magnesium-transporting ATPase (P-type)
MTFFILTIIPQLYNTLMCHKIHAQTGALSQTNMYFKYTLLVLMLIQVAINFAPGEWLEGSGLDDNKGNRMEWTITATIITGFVSMGLDTLKF